MSPALCGAIEGTHVRVQKGEGRAGGDLCARHVSQRPDQLACTKQQGQRTTQRVTGGSVHATGAMRGNQEDARVLAEGEGVPVRTSSGHMSEVGWLALWSRARWGDCQIGSNDLTARGPPSRPRLVRVPR